MNGNDAIVKAVQRVKAGLAEAGLVSHDADHYNETWFTLDMKHKVEVGYAGRMVIVRLYRRQNDTSVTGPVRGVSAWRMDKRLEQTPYQDGAAGRLVAQIKKEIGA